MTETLYAVLRLANMEVLVNGKKTIGVLPVFADYADALVIAGVAERVLPITRPLKSANTANGNNGAGL